jgi:carboxyl-terminal processing protease
MNRLMRTIVVCASLAVFVYVAAGYLMARTGQDKTYNVLTVYSEVLEHIQRDYVDQPNMQKVTNGALHGLLDSLDGESAYLSPLEYADYKKNLEMEGKAEAGLVLSRRYGYIDVVSVLPDSPALKAGLRDGDIFDTIAGFTSGQMSIGQAQILLHGAPGSVVKVTIIRPDKQQPQPFELTLAKLPAEKLLTETLSGGTAYIRVPSFEPGITDELRDKLVALSHAGAASLVLDLRDCAAGKPEEGIAAAQLFLSSGTIATLKGQTVAAQTFSADPARQVWKNPVAVLTSYGTAGPAEILAAAIAENHRGESFGSRTFGTAAQQKTIDLDDGAALILTVANYYTPAGKEILADGIKPDVVVQPPADEYAPAPEANELKPGQLPPPDDPVLKKALDSLHPAPAEHKAA